MIASFASVLAFWRAAGPEKWFKKDTGFDESIRARFLATYDAAAAGKLSGWEQTADHPVTFSWISDEELADNPGLVRTMSVKPPTGSGKIRLVSIGVDGSVDLQPCGGTHVRSTAEIGRVAVTKIEKKGRQNRRIRLAFADSA